MEFCFIQNETSLNLIQSKEHWYKSLIFKGKEKEKVEEKESFEKSAKRIISIYSGSRSKEKWNKAKADENKSDFPKPIIMVKILLKV
jgi:hypothetical protein